MLPSKLQKGDAVRVIAPARSLSLPWIGDDLQNIAKIRFKELGLNLSFGKNVYEIDDFDSSPIESRIDDLHDAFLDKDVKLVITVIGGFNSNQLLRYIDYDLIKKNPKCFCGFSDITALSNAIYAKTGLITYSGPHYFSFGDLLGFDYSFEYFNKCLFNHDSFQVLPSKKWSSDRWAAKQNERSFIHNEGFWVINEGEAKGKILGGNQCTFNLLHGTEYMPSF
jgi:muramoyltetrapeptide carboxypeptidase